MIGTLARSPSHALSKPFFLGGSVPLLKETAEKRNGTLILTSPLEDLAAVSPYLSTIACSELGRRRQMSHLALRQFFQLPKLKGSRSQRPAEFI